MHIKIANLIHFLAIIISILLLFSPMIPFLNFTDKANNLVELLRLWVGSHEFLKLEKTVLILMISADFFSLILFSSPKWLFSSKKRRNFKKFIRDNIKLGMTVPECEKVFENNAFFTRDNNIHYEDNYNTNSSGLSNITFYVELFNASIGGASLARAAFRVIQALMIFILSIFIGLNAEVNEYGERWTIIILGCSVAYYVVSSFIFFLPADENKRYISDKKTFQYCSDCKKLIRWEDLLPIDTRHSGPDFSTGKKKVTTTYEEKRLGWIEFSDESVVGVYEKVPQKNVEITAYSHIHKRVACPCCRKIYSYTLEDEKFTKEYTE